MSERYGTIEIVDKDGWRREFPIQKPLIYIGSDSRNDIVLDGRRGGGVVGRHLQVITLPEGEAGGFRLVNLGNGTLQVGEAKHNLAPHASLDVQGESPIQLGEFTLTLKESGEVRVSFAGSNGGGLQGSKSIGARVRLSQPQLHPTHPSRGVLTIRNMGDVMGVQFLIEMEGLPDDCCEIGPGPVLFPGAEKEMPFFLHHPKGNRPVAGTHTVTFRVTAPEAYPGESAAVSQRVQLMPIFNHKLRLIVADE